jgi:amino acid adenylation domain-containing protein
VPSSILELFRARAVKEPGRPAFTFLADGEGAEQSLSYGELDRRARAVAARLQELGLAGERLLLLFPPGLDYVAAFLGCLYAGAVAVPAYPPTGSRGLPRLRSILADCEPRAILTVASLRAAMEKQAARQKMEFGVPLLDIDAVDETGADLWRDPGLAADALAFLQYTSGSTSTPKGVMVTHGNLAANERMIRDAFGTDEDSVVVSWLPLYHDMGLIGGLLHPLSLGARCILMSPLHFLQRPARWLQAISRYEATVSGGPNFAYELCTRRVTPEETAALDLSRWTVAFNGAEPVRAEVLDRFAAAFAGAGFKRSSFFPCYGLAEATLLVSGGRAGEEPAPAGPVGCGAVAAGLDVRIVDPESAAEQGTGAVGEIWVAGPTVAAGYWKRPEASAETFGARLAGGGGPYLRTGDLGFVRAGALVSDLVITGRIKDLILIRGRNLYPQDVEWTVEQSHPAVRPGCGAAFAVDEAGEERLVVVQEVSDRNDRATLAEVAAAVRQAVAEEHEVQVSTLVLVRAGAVPKTTSGKIQRRACRELFLTGGLAPLGEWREGAGAAGSEGPAPARFPPRTPMEERLARIWEEVLGLAPGSVGAEDNFFALGGDSLRATQLLARLQEAPGGEIPEIPLADLFAAPVLAELAARLEVATPCHPEGASATEGSGRVAASPAQILPARTARPQDDTEGRTFPLTSPQRRLWFLDQLEPGNPAYNLGIAVRLTGALDLPVLARALSEVVRRHEALRTVFRVVDGAPVQIVQPAAPLPLPLVDLTEAGSPETLEREEARRPFDLTRGPLLRAHLVRFGPAEHELRISVHHIVCDGWSFGVLVREIAALYAAFAAGMPSPLSELPVQFGEYALWQEGRLAGDVLEPQVAAWKRRLAGSLPVLELPADRPRPAVPSWRGAHATRVLPKSLAGGLRELAGARGASLFMALAAGFQTLLGRLTVQDDVIVGTAVANRDRVELEGLIGFFVNTLAVRTGLAGDPPFTELLDRARDSVLAALSGREVPFERLVDELQTRRGLAVAPIVQVMLVLQNEPLAVPPVPGLALAGRETDNGTARFDLAVSLLETEEGLAAVFKYSRDLFDAATVERMAGWLETLLTGATVDPGSRLSDLPLLTAPERRQIVVDWNATAAPALLEAGCLHEIVEAQADRMPDAVAVTCEGESLTYRELDRRANQLARHLLRLGVAADALVGVAVERSLDLMVGLLGVLKAGGAYVPLDPSYPAERLAFMMEDAQVPVLLTQDRLLGNVPHGRAQVLCLDTGWPEVIAESADRLAASTVPDSAAYCIYTSGSTGRPKGAVNTHRAIVNRLLWMQSEYGLVPGEAVLQKTPVSFDVSVWELFWPLLAGARVVFARPGGHQDSAYLAELIQRERITTLHFVPSMLQVFLEEPGLGACTSLRRVITSGEALPRELEERFGALLGPLGTELHNLYGPTEAAVDVTAWPCLREPGERTVPIGRPIANVQIHLLDPAGQPVPAGVPGHLHIGGAGLARGYLRRPELTAERFVPDPFADPAETGGRLYATGDLARRRGDGVIEFLGRIDHQVKIRGFRIETGEIEAALNACPGVRESVVSAIDAGGNRRLIAYVVGKSGIVPEADELRSFLAGRLPDYMLPAAFIVLPSFPLNPSGKVDRKALPMPGEPHRPAETPWIAPRTPVEERLAALWSELLGVERVGVLDDFFALGGDSIQGALFVNRLQKELDAIVYVMSLFDAPTVGQFAAYLDKEYRQALVAAGWIEAADAAAADDAPPDAATEAAETAAFSQFLAGRFAHPEARRGAPAVPNPAVVFLLSPFRSGSTLLRVMLAGHPGLFAPPELELLGFESLGERRRLFSGRDSFSREGLLRAVMELRGCGAEEAAALVEEAEERDEPTPAFYRRLQEWAGDRVLVDKTPRYALDLPTLRRAEDWFAEPLYIHLVRHPAATIRSYLEARMQEVYHFPLAPRRQAELIWRRGHGHILEHLAAVPPGRQHRIVFEEMVRDPRRVMEDLCAFLAIEFHPAMLSPYEGERMTDGLHGAGRMMGDPKFHQHRGIDAGVADRWRGGEAAVLGEASWELAERLGYRRPVGPRTLAPSRTGEIDLPLSFGQQRLWFLDRLEPGSSVYNMPAAVRLTGGLDTAALARSCAEIERRHEVLRTVFPSVAGRPRQVVQAPRPARLPAVDLQGLDAPARQIEAVRLVGEEARRPFDLAAGPLWRVRLLRLAAEEHLLLVNLHHIVCDGWSVGVLTRELAALYQGETLPELPLQYADFAAWQRDHLAGPLLQELLGYWKERLTPAPAVLELPLDRPRPPVQTYRGERLPFAVPAAAVTGLKELARTAGATLFMALAAVLQTLLMRLSGQEDVAVGTPVANRNRAEIEELIGLFVNTLVLRSDLSGDPDVRTLLGRVRQVCLGAARHEEMPFEKLVEELGVERSLGHAPLFTVLLVLQNAPPARLELPGLALERLDVDTGTAKFDLTLDLTERRDGTLAGALEFNRDLFDAATAERLARHFASLLAGAAFRPAARLSELPLLSAEELRELAAWNATAAVYDGAETLHGLVEAQVDRTPGAVAVTFEGEALTYGELDAAADRLAHRLREAGAGPEVVVGVCLERSLGLMVALLAVLKAGGAYLPLDPALPAARLRGMVDDAAAPLIVTAECLAAPFAAEAAGRLIFLDQLDREAAVRRPVSGTGPDHAAYVIFTSGSTGRPKGVVNVHRAIRNRLLWMQEAYGLTADDRILQKTPFGFDVSVWELFWPLLTGARLVMARPGGHQDPAYLGRTIAAEGITTLHFVPSLLRVFLQQAPRQEAAGRGALRRVIVSGEELPADLVQLFLERLPGVELHNLYGPTEAAVDVTAWACGPGDRRTVPIGRPIANLEIHLVDRAHRQVPVGVPGELCIGGAGLARGYAGRPELTAGSFVPDAWSGRSGDRLYRTGDLARRRPGGEIEFLGRIDGQVKIRGQRIEPGEIEAALLRHPAVREAVVAARQDRGEKRLVGYVVPAAEGLGEDARRELIAELRGRLGGELPAAMLPAAFAVLDRLPRTASGKVDRKSLPDPGAPPGVSPGKADTAPRNEAERIVAQIWGEVLGLDRVGLDDNFFDLGGHSLRAAEVQGRLRERLGTDLALIELFQHTTVRSLAARLGGSVAGIPERTRPEPPAGRGDRERDIAIVGMAGRFPGAADLDAFWSNLRAGVESISFFSDAELLAAGVAPALLADPAYVRARSVLDGIELFDARLFGFSPREAARIDPQQRLLLETAWQALENAGLDARTFPGRIGVYAGAVFSSYLLQNLLPNAKTPDETWQMVLANDKDTLATRVSYKLGLRGPSFTVQTACSTSLVALHLACQGLLGHECDAALAGGVAVRSAQTSGYVYQEGGPFSPDGHCRPFDAAARGTLFGSGAGLVVLKRLSDALADGDTIRAVIKSSAINNDGGEKIGFTAPSIPGQAEVITRALALGGIDPETVTYVETHGTATPLGDPIEVAGLTRAFRDSGARRGGYCAIGSVKSNFGHLDAAAGVAGLIKAVLALEHREIPPSLHFERPNPQIDFAGSPFFVNGRLRPWEADGGPLRAGVSAFGIGGTNAHVILEEAPRRSAASDAAAEPARPWQVLTLSAQTPAALTAATELLAGHLADGAGHEQALADVAFTLHTGRRALPWRRAVVCRTGEEGRAEAIAALRSGERLLDGRPPEGTPSVAFVFPGQGGQRVGMGRELYATEPLFRREVDRMAEAALGPLEGLDLREVLFPAAGREEEAARLLERTLPAQAALFVLATALARLWMSWGVRPEAMLGHSTGEYVAAHLAGVMSLEDALGMIAVRCRLLDAMPAGATLAVALSADEVPPLLGADLSLAVINGPGQSVVSGTVEAVEALQTELTARGVEAKRLAIGVAAHSPLVEPYLDAFAREIGRFTLRPPEIPYLSCTTGRWISAGEATDPAYWARHLRHTVRFADGLEALLAEPGRILLEVGPDRRMTRLARRMAEARGEPGRVAVPSLLTPDEEPAEAAALLAALGRLWAAGVAVDWQAFHAGERRRRVPLPTYPFERRRHWVEPPVNVPGIPDAAPAGAVTRDPASWVHLPSWRRSLPPLSQAPGSGGPGSWLIFLDGCGLGEAVAERLERAGAEVVRAVAAATAPEEQAALAARLRGEGRRLRGVLHLGSVTAAAPGSQDRDGFERAWRLGIESLEALTRALDGADGVTLAAVTNGTQRVTGHEELSPAKATLLGWLRAVPAAQAPGGGVRRRVLDISLPEPGSALRARLADQNADRLAADLLSAAAEPLVAWRGGDRWVPALEPAPLPAPERRNVWLRPGGTYLLTGGLEGLAFFTVRRLAAAAAVRLAFVADPGHGEEESRDRIRELEGLGAEVMVLEADLADADALRAVIAHVEELWGPIHGVFYLPGLLGRPSHIGMPAWMRGALLLDFLLGDDRPLDFFVLFSWQEPPARLQGQAELWAAGSAIDALAHARAARGARPTVAVDWGPTVDFESPEAADVLDRVLASLAAPQVAVSAPALAALANDEDGADGEEDLEAGSAADAFADDPIAMRIAAIWREVLGVKRVGPRDRFFELGGDSLIALRVMARLRETFPVDLPVRILFERGTIPGLRDAVEESLTAKLEALSEEEAERLVESFLA